jgi:hypothetical protein
MIVQGLKKQDKEYHSVYANKRTLRIDQTLLTYVKRERGGARIFERRVIENFDMNPVPDFLISRTLIQKKVAHTVNTDCIP